MKAFMSFAVPMLLLAGLMPPSVEAQNAPAPSGPEPGASLLARVVLPAKGDAKLTVSTPAWKPGGDIPFENTQYRGNVFPGLQWNAGPSGTQSYVIIMQDPDAMRNGAPILHWTMFNISGTVTKLDAGMTAPPAGAQFGPNIRGASQPYMGPRTPPGPKHRYHLQVFALDTTLGLQSNAGYGDLTDGMRGHVLASGEVTGLGQAAPPGPGH
jgi:para-nitrobenzyl esterase